MRIFEAKIKMNISMKAENNKKGFRMPYGKIIYVCIIAMIVSPLTYHTAEIILISGVVIAFSLGLAFARVLEEDDWHV